MAEYWASKSSLPSTKDGECNDPELLALVALSDFAKGLSVKQGQIDIFGAIDMLGALQYHYQQFLRVIRQKSNGEIPFDAPDERYEAVAYIGRLGQFFYFATSPFARTLLGVNPERLIPAVVRLVPLRHKYAAHRARDKPLKGTDEHNDLNAELGLGALGGWRFAARARGSLGRQHSNSASDLVSETQPHSELYYTLFELHTRNGRIEFNLELDHPVVLSEAAALVRNLIDRAKNTPRE